ncbi:MAG: cellulase family glycosylhydrolase [Lachnospiraceae bacterium]|nr:cellulase family glycosylhydrolase [Lachnospiraceae bacterium]
MKTNKLWGKFLAGVLSLGLLFGGMFSDMAALQVKAADNSQTVSAKMPFRQMTADEMVAEMGTGWNLGNTMDGHTGFTPNETLWQNVETTQELIKAVHDMGFNTIRIPVTWGTMIDDSNNYAIDEKWMSRVQDIVDYAINMNMYAIINVHHDGAEQSGWLRIAAEDLDPVKEKYEAVWKQIAERFKDYDEHLIFESMNEVCGPEQNIAEDTALIMQFNQIFVDTVRATGSNNEERWLSVPGRYTNIVNTTKEEAGFELPTDTVEKRLFVAVHYYDWSFGMLESMGVTNFTYNSVPVLQSDFVQLEKFTSNGIPVILGEYGAINKLNDVDRTYHLQIVNRMCQQIGIVPVYWDQGWFDLSMSPDYSYTLVDRDKCEAIYPNIIAGILRGLYFEGNDDLSDVVHGETITSLADLGTASESSLSMQIGDVKDISLSVDKSSANDVVLWKSSNETVASVNADGSDLSKWCANVHATGIGNAVITAYSQSGSAVLEIPVEVKAKVATVPCTAITAEQESYVLTEGQSVFLNASMSPADTDAYLTYRSSNTDVISVSKLGKVVAKAVGSAYVIITSSDGKTAVVPVTVEAAEVQAQIALGLNVYYNDSNLNYFSNEVASQVITVSEDGTYTLSFDCATDLSANAISAGVSSLTNLTAIYIKDDSVTKGLAKKSPLVSCDIIYDSIVIDGVPFEVHMDAPKSAIKASGIFDTNDPINSWDGSVIEEVFVNNHVLNFTELPNPQKIEVTFTLSNLVFEEGAGEVATVQTESIKVNGVNTVTVDNTAPVEISVIATPSGAGKITFVSSNTAVVSVDNTAVTVGSDGIATTTIYAHGEGKAVITAYAENGIATVISVSATIKEVEETPAETPAEDTEVSVTPETEGSEVEPESEEPKAPVESTDDTQQEKPDTDSGLSTMQLILIIVGIIVLGGAVFFITLKIAGGSPAKPEEKKEEASVAATPTEETGKEE